LEGFLNGLVFNFDGGSLFTVSQHGNEGEAIPKVKCLGLSSYYNDNFMILWANKPLRLKPKKGSHKDCLF